MSWFIKDLGEIGLDRLCRAVVKNGDVGVQFPSGAQRRYGEGGGEPIRLRIADAKSVRRILANPALAIGECYADGTLIVESGDLAAAICVLLGNAADHRKGGWLTFRQTLRRLRRRLDQFNPQGRSKKKRRPSLRPGRRAV